VTTSEARGEADLRTTTFASLHILTYRRLWIAGAISFFAVQAQVVARGWLANELGGTNAALGGVYMAFGLPMLLATPFAGVLADRLSKRTLLVASQAALASTAAWIGVGVTAEFVEYWMLLVASAIQAVAFAFLAPARMAMTSEVVGRDLLSNAIVLSQMSLNGTRVVGPALAGIGIGIAWFGTAGVYYSSAILSLVAMALMLRLPSGKTKRSGPARSPLREFADGLAYVRERPDVRLLIITSFVVVMVAFPYIAFLPRVASDIFDKGAGGYGALAAASAVGAVAASLYIASRSSGPRAWRIQTLSGFGFGIGLVLLAVSPTFGIALISVAEVGAASSAFQSMNNSLVLGLSDFEYHGRIQSLMMLSFSGFGMAALPLGALADEIGLRVTFAWMGVGAIFVMGWCATVRQRQRQRQIVAIVDAV
jgi:MFS family permease